MKPQDLQKYSYTPPEIAAMLGIAHAKILNWIRSGELKCHNLRTKQTGQRPRYVVLHSDLTRPHNPFELHQPQGVAVAADEADQFVHPLANSTFNSL